MKKIIASIIIPLLLFCGCSVNEQLEPETPEPQAVEEISETTAEKKSSDIFTDAEKESIEKEMLKASESVWEIYNGIELGEYYGFGSAILNFTDEQRISAAESLGKLGYAVRTKNADTENPELVESFYRKYKSGEDAEITVIEVCDDGLISTLTFFCRSGRIQTYYAGIAPDENKKPHISDRLVQNIDFINLTEKGYFIYAYENIMTHQSLCEYFRIKPLSGKCRELTEKYLKSLDYRRYNLLLTDWNESNVSEILMPGLFEDFYFIKYEETYPESDCIPAEIFEDIMTTYLPVTVSQLRKAYDFDEMKNEYHQKLVFNLPYSPFGEVVSYKNNSDGTITLCADGVWPDYNSDYAFTNELVIQPLGENEFRILSNKVEEKELKLPEIVK